MKIIKTLSIGDLHGLDIWKKGLFGEIYDMDNFDKIIFIGDYVDSFTISPIIQINNLKTLIELKLKFPDKIILLFGNHDVHYSHYPKYRCTGFQTINYPDYMKLFLDNLELFQLSYQIQNTIWTHAGIHSGWYKQNIKKYHDKNSNLSLSEILNRDFKHEKNWIFQVGHRRGGSANMGGPLWLDRTLLWKKPLLGYHQIVGHTRIYDGNGIKEFQYNDNTKLTCIDVLDNEYAQFYIKEFMIQDDEKI